MSLDLPKFIRAEAERASLFAQLVERADELGRWEQTIADAVKRVDTLRKAAVEAEKSIAGTAAKADALVADAHTAAAKIADDAKSIMASAEAAAAKVRADALEAAKVAKAKENAAEAAEKKALDGIKAAESKLAAVTKAMADAEVVIAKATAIRAAMG